MKYYLFSIFIILFLFNSTLSSESLKQHSISNLIVGKWYDKEELYNGGYREYLLEKEDNGSYKITLRTYTKDGEYKEQIEIGEWGVSGSVYFTLLRGVVNDGKFTPIDSPDLSDKEKYKILYISDSEFKYQHIECEDVYIMKKVPNSFTLTNK